MNEETVRRTIESKKISGDEKSSLLAELQRCHTDKERHALYQRVLLMGGSSVKSVMTKQQGFGHTL